MTTLVQTGKKEPKNLVSPAQKTFNRLKKKIEGLQKKHANRKIILEESLKFYHASLKPVKEEALIQLTKCLKRFYNCYLGEVKLTKKMKKSLEDLIKQHVEEILRSYFIGEIDPELIKIYEKLEGISLKDAYKQEMSEGLGDLESMFSDMGVDIDLSEIDTDLTQEEVFRKVLESVAEAKEKMGDQEPPPKAKSKKQLEKEKKALELENLQKNGLSTIYKQLAKVLHPDLEPDINIKKEKEELMKKLTQAYEKEDLHTLLTLEMEWLNKDENRGDSKAASDQRLKIYNSILQEQVNAMEMGIQTEYLNPRYFEITEFFELDANYPIGPMKEREKAFKERLGHYEVTLKALQQPNKGAILKDILHEFEDESSDFDSDCELDAMIEEIFRLR